MRLSRRARVLLRAAVGLALAFIYIPLIVIVIYAFNSSKILEWPPPGFTTELVHQGVRKRNAPAKRCSPRSRPASSRPRSRSSSAPWPRSPSGATASSAARRSPSSSSCRSPCPASSPASPSATPSPRCSASSLSLFTVIIGHATFCIVVVYNNVVARLRRTSGSFEEASADLGADPWQTFRFVTFPSTAHRARRRRPARLRPLLRRDHRHQLHDRRRRRNPADLDLPQPLPPQPAADRRRRRGDRDPDLDHPRLPRPPPEQRGRRGYRGQRGRSGGCC